MINIRDLIKEATCRIGLVPRKQSVPGNILESAFNHLKGIINKYNNDNLLSFTQNSLIIPNKKLIHIYDETDYLKGENNLYFDSIQEMNSYVLTVDDYDNNVIAMVKGYDNIVYGVGVIQYEDHNEYRWFPQQISEPYSQRIQEMKLYQQMTHINVRNLNKINSIYIITNTNEEYRELFKLDFVNHTDFDRYSPNSKCFTYTHKSEGEWLIEFKPLLERQPYRMKLNYNEGVEFDLDSDLYIPDNYIELLIVALAHKLSIQYPRLDEAQMVRLQNEVAVLVDNVRTPKASDRMLQREDYFSGPRRMSQADLMSGDWIFQ